MFNLFSKKSNTRKNAEHEFDILEKYLKDKKCSITTTLQFKKEILNLVDKFGKLGSSAPFTASELSETVKKLCLQQPISPIMNTEDEWYEVGTDVFQNNRCSAMFKNGINGEPYYLDALIWRIENYHTTYGTAYLDNSITGDVYKITSHQTIKEFPFEPKTFYIDVKQRWSDNDDDYDLIIVDEKELEKANEIYKINYKQYDWEKS